MRHYYLTMHLNTVFVVLFKAGDGYCDVGGLAPERRDSRPKMMKTTTTTTMMMKTKILELQPPSEVPIELEAFPQHAPQ
jgi:hypothetical protein